MVLSAQKEQQLPEQLQTLVMMNTCTAAYVHMSLLVAFLTSLRPKPVSTFNI